MSFVEDGFTEQVKKNSAVPSLTFACKPDGGMRLHINLNDFGIKNLHKATSGKMPALCHQRARRITQQVNAALSADNNNYNNPAAEAFPDNNVTVICMTSCGERSSEPRCQKSQST